MKRIVFAAVFLALSAINSNSYGQDLIPKRCSGRKWGFKNGKTGVLVIPCKYDKVMYFIYHEWTTVKLNGKWGFIDKTGKEIIPLKFDNVSEFDGRVALVKLNGKWGYSDITGTFYPNIKAWESARFLAIEREEREREAREREASFIYFAKNYVEPKITNWQQKGEFERTDDWKQRVNENSIKDKGAELIKEAELAFIAEHSQKFDADALKLGAYNADKETYMIHSIYGDWLVNVPIEEAPSFRDNWNSKNMINTPQFVISNDQLTLEGMKFTSAETVMIKNELEPVDVTSNNVAFAGNDATLKESPITENAYDIITLRNGDEIRARVTEVSAAEIRYKRFEILNGPTIVVSRAEVFAINYENGTREVINAVGEKSTARTSTNASNNKGRVGLLAGVNFSNLTNFANNSDLVDVKKKLGIQAGLTGVIPLGNAKFAIKTGLSYSQLGTIIEIKENVLGLGVTGKITLHSLHFPAHIQYKFGDSSTTLLLHGGFYLDYYMRLDYETTVNGKKIDSGSFSIINEDNLTNDIGIGLGAALLIQNKCQIGVGYDVGVKTRNLMVTLTLMFGK